LPRSTPEILEADVTSLALELAVSGVAEPGTLQWLDPPPAAALTEARALLRQLEALDPAGAATPHGRRMAELGTHPRLAHLLLRGAELGATTTAAQLAALLEERDILRGAAGPPDPEIHLRLELLENRGTPPLFHGWSVDRGTLQRVREESRAWRESLQSRAGFSIGSGQAQPSSSRPPVSLGEPPSPGALLALAYPDRIGKRRAGQVGRFLLRNGQGAATDSATLARAEYLVAAELDGDRRESRIWLGSSLTETEVLDGFSAQVERMEVVAWDDGADAVVAVERRQLGAIIMSERPLRDPDPELLRRALLGWIRSAGLGVLPWTESGTELRERLAFLHLLLGAPWPDVSEVALLGALPDWLDPHLTAVRRRTDLSRIDLEQALLGMLGWEERRALESLAPTHLSVPTGSRIRLSYADPAAPVLAVRLQEVFGMTETPRVGGGRVAVTMQLLSPAQRPVQVTRDLAGFWRTSYFDVKKEMKGRYPRHHWPDNPLVAEPTRRAKPKGR
jgi:ATP-dependent helicase HrpB